MKSVVKTLNIESETLNFKIIIAGGTGFLGKSLEKYFTEKGDQVYILTRNPKRKMKSIGMPKP